MLDNLLYPSHPHFSPTSPHTHTPHTQMFDPSHAPTSPMEEGDAVDGEERERERDTKHAPDLLEGPNINSEGLAHIVV